MNTLTPRLMKLIRYSATGSVLTVFVASLLLSWNGLTQLALNAGIHPSLAWALPLCIDGTVVAGSLRIVQCSLVGASTRFGWTLALAGAGISIWGNVSAHPDLALTGSITHALAPLAMATALHSITASMRHRVAQTQQAAQEAAAADLAAQKAQEQAQEQAARREAAMATQGGVAAEFIKIVAALPEGTSDTDKVLAILNAGHAKPSASALALALDKEAGAKGERLAHKALERARNKMRTSQTAPTHQLKAVSA